jgi:hypothetical protein
MAINEVGTMTITPSDLPTIYGCCGLFDLCSDLDLMSLSFQGQSKFLDWIGWEKSDVCIIKKNFITFVRPERTSQGARSAGYIQDSCGDSNGVEWGTCDFTLEKYGLLRRHGPERIATDIGKKYCEIQPRYRLDGSPILNDTEFDMRLATEAMVQDLKRMIIDGNKSTTGQFDGLQRLIKTGYTASDGHRCESMDSIIVDWNDNALAGGAGITWNGKAVSATADLVDVLLAILRRIRDRIAMAPALSSAAPSVGDIIIVAPAHILRCLLDLYTCWSVCPGATNIVVAIQSFEARTFRNNLNGGMFGAGRIFLDGFEVPLMDYDWGLTDEVTGASDMYILTGQIGNMKLISGQYADMSKVPAGYPTADYSYTDGGKFLTWVDRQKTCILRETEMQPRLLLWAPWAQARIQDIVCDSIGGILGPDPWVPSFFPESSFCIPACPA